jgi:hypothetical protein
LNYNKLEAFLEKLQQDVNVIGEFLWPS